jgi:hypothetical protein
MNVQAFEFFRLSPATCELYRHLVDQNLGRGCYIWCFEKMSLSPFDARSNIVEFERPHRLRIVSRKWLAHTHTRLINVHELINIHELVNIHELLTCEESVCTSQRCQMRVEKVELRAKLLMSRINRSLPKAFALIQFDFFQKRSRLVEYDKTSKDC